MPLNPLAKFVMRNAEEVPRDHVNGSGAIDVGYCFVAAAFDRREFYPQREKFKLLIEARRFEDSNDPERRRAYEEFTQVAEAGGLEAALEFIKRHGWQEPNGVDLFDGRDYDIGTIETWIGNRPAALRFMALAEHFGIATVMTPRRNNPNIQPHLEQILLDSGLVAIRGKHPEV